LYLRLHIRSSSGFLTTNVGTPGYTAPEVIAGDDDYDLSVDVFALAVLMWQVRECVCVSIEGLLHLFVCMYMHVCVSVQCATSEEDPWPECRSSWDVSDAITDGRRPKITHVAFQGCDPALPQLISAMWSQDPLSRPTVQDVVKRLEEMSGRDK
jgi:serine/threonine protein kinase